MKKLANPIPAGKLRLHTSLKEQVSNITRWSSTAHMLRRFMDIKDILPKLEIEEIDLLIPPLAAVREIEKLCNIFEELDAVKKELQRNDLNLADVRALFDTVLEVYPRADLYLAKSSSIVHCTDFENAIVKVIDNQEFTLSQSESNLVRCFIVEHDCDIVESNMNDKDLSRRNE